MYAELEELDPATFETRAGSILNGLGFKCVRVRCSRELRLICILLQAGDDEEANEGHVWWMAYACRPCARAVHQAAFVAAGRTEYVLPSLPIRTTILSCSLLCIFIRVSLSKCS